jgi:hypothetical protein
VNEVWIVDPEERTIQVHSAAASSTSRAAKDARSRVVSGFVLVPDMLFA